MSFSCSFCNDVSSFIPLVICVFFHFFIVSCTRGLTVSLIFSKDTVIGFIDSCYGQSIYIPPQVPRFICGDLIPNVIVFGLGAFGRWLSNEGGALKNGISTFIKETPKMSLHLLPCEIWPLMNQEVGPH